MYFRQTSHIFFFSFLFFWFENYLANSAVVSQLSNLRAATQNQFLLLIKCLLGKKEKDGKRKMMMLITYGGKTEEEGL